MARLSLTECKSRNHRNIKSPDLCEIGLVLTPQLQGRESRVNTKWEFVRWITNSKKVPFLAPGFGDAPGTVF